MDGILITHIVLTAVSLLSALTTVAGIVVMKRHLNFVVMRVGNEVGRIIDLRLAELNNGFTSNPPSGKTRSR